MVKRQRNRAFGLTLSSVHASLRHALLIVGVSAFAAGGAAHAQQNGEVQTHAAPVNGGAGGKYFEYACGPGRALAGLRGSAGVLVDAVQAVCARVDAAGSLTDPAAQGPVFGGARPFDKAADCPPGYVVTNLAVSENEIEPLIGAIDVICQEFAYVGDGGRTIVQIAGSGHLRGYTEPVLLTGGDNYGEYRISPCPDQMIAVGIRGRSSQYLDALGLICAPKAAPSSVGAAAPDRAAELVGKEISLQSSNFLDRFVRHRNSLGFIEPIDGDLARADSAFRIAPGLAGRCVSFESKNFPGQYLRHEFWRIKLAPMQDSELYRNDATFCMTPGLGDSAGVSLQSASHPDRFIRHKNFELWVEPFDGGDVFRRDATFNLTQPGGVLYVR